MSLYATYSRAVAGAPTERTAGPSATPIGPPVRGAAGASPASTTSGVGGSAAAASWYGGFECGCLDSRLFPYSSFVPGHVFPTLDPLGSGREVLEYAINNGDQPYPGALPRGDVESPKMFFPGDDWYISIPTLIPSGFPTINNQYFFQVAEIYGPPYGGSPTVGLDLESDSAGRNHLKLDLDAAHSGTPWVGPALDGRWHTLTLHVHFATDSSGFVQLWYDGVLQTFNGRANNVTFTSNNTQINYATLVSGVNWDGRDGNFVNIDSYRARNGYPGTVTLFHGAPAIGGTLASVGG
jgi:hypothetical protein